MAKLASGWILHSDSGSESQSIVVTKHAKLVKRIAQHLLGRLPPSVQLEDLIQAGMIGLLEASKNYDFSKGASFETYASIRIRGSMLDEIRKGDWAPRSVHRNTRRIAEAIRKIENQEGRDPRNFEVAKNLNINLDEYHRLLQDSNGSRMYAFYDVGLNEEIISEGMAVTSLSPLEGLQQDDFKNSLARGIETLPEREQLVLRLYYDEELNLRKIGDILGVSESRVSQIHSQAMSRLQSRLKTCGVKEKVK
ncbi:MAG TPA: RNA polymerase sigma factor FliA [Gammaproteobacteria bacterium]|nr:RNA polymerase sigma factor FliA [Gammaproteobacteria bacterium]HQZ87256.1 RNA polymerase sigma factor FliA [Gammaproteobacteria bacterium]HRA42143.1 RNA polymerase sigma factor FliA [Gammaproteobacteria bacterium]